MGLFHRRRKNPAMRWQAIVVDRLGMEHRSGRFTAREGAEDQARVLIEIYGGTATIVEVESLFA